MTREPKKQRGPYPRNSPPAHAALLFTKCYSGQVVPRHGLRRQGERLRSRFYDLDVESEPAARAASESEKSAAICIELLDLRGLAGEIDVPASRRVLCGRDLRSIATSVQGEGGFQRRRPAACDS